MYNAVLGGSSLDGCRFAYDNPLQRRTNRTPDGPDRGPRTEWKLCACCPPNLMRTLSTWQQYLATTDGAGIQVHQFAAGEIVAPLGEGAARLGVATGYPWRDGVAITIAETPERPWTLSVRAPAWTGQAPLHESRSWQPRRDHRARVRHAAADDPARPARRCDSRYRGLRARSVRLRGRERRSRRDRGAGGAPDPARRTADDPVPRRHRGRRRRARDPGRDARRCRGGCAARSPTLRGATGTTARCACGSPRAPAATNGRAAGPSTPERPATG